MKSVDALASYSASTSVMTNVKEGRKAESDNVASRETGNPNPQPPPVVARKSLVPQRHRDAATSTTDLTGQDEDGMRGQNSKRLAKMLLALRR